MLITCLFFSFFYLDNNLTGDERITHLKDHMRECQKVFFNLKSALVKIEKQRKVFLRKQKPFVNTTSATSIFLKYKKNRIPLFNILFLFSYANNIHRNFGNINMYINLK
jgi:uncharacterized membrane protein (DUF106 family)